MTNIATELYNCGGYALETYDWYDPSPLDINIDYYDEFINEDLHIDDGVVYDTIYEALLDGDLTESHLMEYMVHNILIDVHRKIRRINDLSELQENEYGVLFRGGCDDFHFIKYEDGVFSHKMGGRKVEILDISEEWEIDWLGYTSETYYFAIARR
jgi:hypothetical protein